MVLFLTLPSTDAYTGAPSGMTRRLAIVLAALGMALLVLAVALGR